MPRTAGHAYRNSAADQTSQNISPENTYDKTAGSTVTTFIPRGEPQLMATFVCDSELLYRRIQFVSVTDSDAKVVVKIAREGIATAFHLNLPLSLHDYSPVRMVE
jgi:hypothetical protein